MSDLFAQWPKAYPETDATGVLKQQNTDFKVIELPDANPTEQGEHIWLYIRKDGANTGYVAQCLADYAGVKNMDVGYAGLKDRHAITEQWFSIYFPKHETPDFFSLKHDEFTVLKQTRHIKKLRRGDLIGNTFDITLRDVAGDKDHIESNLQQIKIHGTPNYFGTQRFGHGGDNIEQGRMMLAREIRVNSQKKKGIYLSAVRAFIFNEILAERIKSGRWSQALDGDVTDTAAQATGALWGRGRVSTHDAAAALENTIAERHAALCEGLEHAGLTQERRALAAKAEYLSWEWVDDTTLNLRFTLSAGCYATMLIREILDVREPDRYQPQA